MYLINYLSRHGQTGPIPTIDLITCIETDTIMSPLDVASGMVGDGTNGICGDAVVMLFMYLHILTKFYLAVCIKVKCLVQYKFSVTLCLRDATLESKHVSPKHFSIH